MRNKLVLLGLALAGLVACGTEKSDNQPPTVVISGAPMGTFVVGDTMHIQVDAQDPEGGAVTFDWDFKPKTHDWTADDRAEFLTFSASAVFEWDPLASDATAGEPIQLIFIVTDDVGQVTEKTVSVNIVAGNGLPVFQSNASELYDPRTGEPLSFEVRVSDNDSNEVDLQLSPDTAPVGSSFERTGPFTGRFTWTPTPEQLDRRIHSVNFSASDGDNPTVDFKVTIVIRSAGEIDVKKDQTDQMCPGEAAISHTPIGPQRSAIDPYRFEATLADPRFDEVILYWTFADAYNGDFDPNDESRRMASVAMEDQGGTWVAELAPQTSVINPTLGALTMYYQICAIDNDAAAEAAIVCTPSSGDLELYNSFTAYLPDAEDCVDDPLDLSSNPNDSFDTSAGITERWQAYRACSASPDYHALQVRAGETYLIAAVYPRGSNLTLEAFDDSQAPTQLKTSTCTGMATLEVSVPEGGATQNFYIKGSGDNVNYVVRAFKTQGGAGGCLDDANEPNEDGLDATPVSSGDAFQAEICSVDDVDVYRITLNGGDQLTVTNSFQNAVGNLDMTLFPPSQATEVNKSGNGVAFTFSFDDMEELTHTATETGSYFLLVFNNNETSVPYDISFQVQAAPPCPDSDQYSGGSGNHSQTDAALIDSTDGFHEYTGLSVCPGKPDWYRRSEFNGAPVLGELTVTGGDGSIADVTFGVYDLQGNPVATASPVSGRLDLDFTPSSTAAHFFKVETTARVEYQFSLLR